MEFAHAVVDRLLAGSSRLPPVYYVGVLREEQKDGSTALETKIYNHWDSSDMAPPKRRPVDPISEPSLEFLGWAQGAPMFPQAAEQKFPEGCPAHAELMNMKKLLVAEFPDAGQQQQQPDRTAPRPSTTRAIGRPDYTIEGGHQPLDVTRVLDKEVTAASAFNVPRQGCSFFFLGRFSGQLLARKAYCSGSRTKPSVMISNDYSIYLGNETEQEITLNAMELFGFNIGNHEVKVISGRGGVWVYLYC